MTEIEKIEQEIGEEIYELYKKGKLNLQWTGVFGTYEFVLNGEVIKEPVIVSIYRRYFFINEPIMLWIKSKYAKKIFKEQQEKDRLDKDRKFLKILKDFYQRLKELA